jgi:hypothetical protein
MVPVAGKRSPDGSMGDDQKREQQKTLSYWTSLNEITHPIALSCRQIVSSRQAENPQAMEAIKARDEPEGVAAFAPSRALF